MRIKGALSALGYVVHKELPDPVAPADSLSTGSLYVCTPTGEPIVNHIITVETVVSINPTTLNGIDYYASLIGGSLILRTDEEGKVSVRLLKGTTVRIYLEGSALYREIIVPNEDFSLLDPDISTGPDAFSSPIAAPKLVIRGDL